MKQQTRAYMRQHNTTPTRKKKVEIIIKTGIKTRLTDEAIVWDRRQHVLHLNKVLLTNHAWGRGFISVNTFLTCLTCIQ